jgi:hypothetical protein
MFEVPDVFQEAWDHACEWQRAKWRLAIKLELMKMERMGVWKKVMRSIIPKGRRSVKCKWVFDIKRNGVFRARLVACGYSQIPGVDFTEAYSPVVNDVSFRILIVVEILLKLDSQIMDVEVAFLNGDLEEEIYMDCPKGMVHFKSECLLLEKALYGLVQAARQFFKKFVQIMKKIGFKQSDAEPCLLYRKEGKDVVMVVIHVDDCYMIGTKAGLKKTTDQIQQNGLTVKVDTSTSDYLSCEIVFDAGKTKAWLGQPHMVKKLETKYQDLIATNRQEYMTPGTPGLNIIRPPTPDDALDEADQKLFRSGVGSLLQFIKYSRPDVANAVRELSKCMDKATPAAFKEMKRVMKFIVSTRDFGLKIAPKVPESEVIKWDDKKKPKVIKWVMHAYTDSDWAGDKDNRRSVSGYVIFLLGVPILWKSKLQRSVSLSSSEAEYYALSEAAKDIKFILQILKSVDIKVELPIIVRVDNVGAIFMSETASATARTKHIDTRYHFIREFVEDGVLKIVFVQTADNRADMFTKNVTSEIYEKHVGEFVHDKSVITPG